MKKILTSLVAAACLWTTQAEAQCPFNNSLYLNMTPAAAGQTVSDGCVWGGDLVTTNVVAGQTYVFSTCNNLFGWDSQLTLYNAAGTTVLGYNDDLCGTQSEITWVATYTGVVNVVIDVYNCASNSTCLTYEVTWLAPPACTALPLEPICTSTGLNYPAGVTGTDATVTDPSNNWDCLLSAPDAEFFYLEIATAGNINMQLTGASDVDFIIWGPYPNLATAESYCGNWGNGGAAGTVMDCSFSTAATEFPDITGAAVGQVYVMVITNFSGAPQNLVLTQVGGTGSTDCSIVCPADAGTVTASLNGTTTASPLYMCANGCVTLTSNNDFTLPPPAPGESSELMYAIYDCPPTTGDPATDPCWTGYYWTGSTFTDCNNATSALLGLSLGSHFWLAPITADDSDDVNPATIGHDNNADGCFDQGAPIEIYYLTNITQTAVQTCGPNSVVMTLAGGLPAASASATYSATDVGAGTMVQSGTQGQTLTFTGVNNGDVISVNVTSGGCTFNFQFTVNCSACAADPGQW